MQALMHKVGRGFWILNICIQTPLIKTKILKKPFSKWFRLCCWQSSVRVWKHNWFTGPPSNHSTSSSISAAFTLNTQCIMWGKVTIGSPVRQPTNTLHIARHTKTLIMHITKCIWRESTVGSSVRKRSRMQVHSRHFSVRRQHLAMHICAVQCPL